MKVFVYFNLHKHLWSIRALEGPHKGLVVAHAGSLSLINTKCKVSEKGRQRVLESGRKNVHAGIEGELESADIRTELRTMPNMPYFYMTRHMEMSRLKDGNRYCQITYNPRKYESFVTLDGGYSKVTNAQRVSMNHGEVIAQWS